MLDGFRKHSNSIVVKALLFLLIASFAAWGVGDMLQPAATGSSVAEVDGVEISAQEVFNDYQREMARMRQLTGDQGINDQLSLAIGANVVDRAISRTLLEVGADGMDVAISDSLVSQAIRSNQMFQDAGTFNRARFEQVMFSNEMNEAQFIELVRGELARNQIISVLTNGATLPNSVAQDLYKHRQEKRSADVVMINKNTITGIAAPSDDEVRKYYDDNIVNFMAPEYRQLSLLHITVKDIAKTIEVPVEALEDAFSERQGEFKKEARRTVDQMVFSSKEEANGAMAQLANAISFEDVAKNKGVASVSLGDVTKSDLPEELQEAVFNLGMKGIDGPFESALGWHIVNVTKITDGVNPSFDDVKDQLRDDVALEMAGEELFGISNSIEDALGGGSTIEDAAKTAGFDLITIASVDANGLDKDGKTVEALVGQQIILSESFKQDMQSEAQMIDDGFGGYFMSRVNEVVETTARPFDSVKSVVSVFVTDLKKFDAAKKQAEDLIARVKAGNSLSDAAKEASLMVTMEKNFTRFDAPFPTAVVSGLFSAKIGETATGINKDGHVVAVLSEIKSTEGAADEAAIDALRKEMANAVSADLQGQFVNALRKSHKVSVDNAMMNRIFSTDQQDQTGHNY